MDYDNLDNGKVIHLVIRPLDAPRNPQNDYPRPANRRYYGHRHTGRPFSSFGTRLPAMEGYTLITLDAQLDPGDNTSLISSIINGIANANPFLGAFSSQYGRPPSLSSPNTDATSTPTTGQQNSASILTGLGTRSPFEARRSTDTNNTNSTDNPRSSLRLPFPSSVEMRLSRTVAYIRNVRNILDAPIDQNMSQIPYTSASSPELIQEIRSTLRGNGNAQTHQVGTVMNDMADLMEQSIPWLRDIGRTLQNEPSPTDNEENVLVYRRVLRAARVIQGMSLINHFLGSVLASADIDSRRHRDQDASPFTPSVTSNLGSWLSADIPRNTSSSTASANTTDTSERTITQTSNITKESNSTKNNSESEQLLQEKSDKENNTGIKRKISDVDNNDDNAENSSNKKQSIKGKGKESKEKTD
ncbi:unnamed protein product [Cunninghamella blakesleeana]